MTSISSSYIPKDRGHREDYTTALLHRLEEPPLYDVEGVGCEEKVKWSEKVVEQKKRQTKAEQEVGKKSFLPFLLLFHTPTFAESLLRHTP